MFQQQQSSHQSYSQSTPQAQVHQQHQQYIKPWTSGSSSSFLDQQPYMTNALFYPQSSSPNSGAGADMFLSRIPNIPQQPYPGPYPMMANAGQMYQPYYQPYFPNHRTSVSYPCIIILIVVFFFFLHNCKKTTIDTKDVMTTIIIITTVIQQSYV